MLISHIMGVTLLPTVFGAVKYDPTSNSFVLIMLQKLLTYCYLFVMRSNS